MTKREWRVLILLVISGFLNYIDRANLSVGATDIQRELHLSTYHVGLLLSAFFWTYALLQLFNVAGWVADRFNVCWVLAAGFFLWSGATAATGLGGEARSRPPSKSAPTPSLVGGGPSIAPKRLPQAAQNGACGRRADPHLGQKVDIPTPSVLIGRRCRDD